jgi:hypothetical protein
MAPFDKLRAGFEVVPCYKACVSRKKQEGTFNKKERLRSVCSPTHRKERDGWGTQFHPLWVGKAGGDSKENKAFPRPQLNVA